jgi:hypothetical protein
VIECNRGEPPVQSGIPGDRRRTPPASAPRR